MIRGIPDRMQFDQMNEIKPLKFHICPQVNHIIKKAILKIFFYVWSNYICYIPFLLFDKEFFLNKIRFLVLFLIF